MIWPKEGSKAHDRILDHQEELRHLKEQHPTLITALEGTAAHVDQLGCPILGDLLAQALQAD